ncbi:MAG TPA: hypothetical protein VNO30_33220 [Kofleriaceae bacterium]|nr:hypothetical protein [Kofleriaceae bacterium]
MPEIGNLPEIEIPSGHRALVAKLVSLPDEQASSLITELRNTPPALSRSELASRIAPATKFDEDTARAIVDVLTSMYEAMARIDEKPDRFVAAVIAAAKKLPSELFEQNVDWEKAQKLIGELMRLERSLGVSSKVLGVITDHAHVYCRSRVLTDIRPVFSISASHPPAALAVIHTLRLTYHSGDETQGFYVALDAADLEDLREQIERALEKEKSLRAMLTEKQLPVLSASEVR